MSTTTPEPGSYVDVSDPASSEVVDARPHKLIVRVVGEPRGPTGLGEFEDFEIVHYDNCPRRVERDAIGNEPAWWEYACWVATEAKEGDVRWMLDYSGTPVTEPGEYMIEPWSETYHGFDYTEYDGGLRLVPA